MAEGDPVYGPLIDLLEDTLDDLTRKVGRALEDEESVTRGERCDAASSTVLARIRMVAS